MTCSIRKATVGDAPQATALVRELASDMGGTSPVSDAYVAEYLEFPGSGALLAEDDGQGIGLLSYSVRPGLTHAGNSALIEELVVTRRARGKGVGGMLVDALLARLQAEGCAEVSVATMPDNAGALRFYRSHGLFDEAVFLEKHFEAAGTLTAPRGSKGGDRSRLVNSWLSTAEAVVSPREFSADLEARTAVICFSDRCYQALLGAFGLDEAENAPGLAGGLAGKVARPDSFPGGGLAVYLSHFGAPAAGMLMECLTASGISRVFMLGTAGSISPLCRIGDIVLPTWGISEEGLSRHYLAAGSVPMPSSAMVEALRHASRGDDGRPDVKEGGVWTTDAIFRETVDKVREYSAEGALAIEMECTALMSVAAFRKLDFAALLVITDELFGDAWEHDFGGERVRRAREAASRILARAVAT